MSGSTLHAHFCQVLSESVLGPSYPWVASVVASHAAGCHLSVTFSVNSLYPNAARPDLLPSQAIVGACRRYRPDVGDAKSSDCPVIGNRHLGERTQANAVKRRKPRMIALPQGAFTTDLLVPEVSSDAGFVPRCQVLSTFHLPFLH